MNVFQFSIVIRCIRQSKLTLHKIPSPVTLDKGLHNTALFK